MGSTKVSVYSEKDQELALIFKALAHPARIAILKYLLTTTSCVCGDIVSEMPLSQSTVSQHLKELRNSGIIKGEIDGNNVCYCINNKVWDEHKTVINNFFKQSLPIIQCC